MHIITYTWRYTVCIMIYLLSVSIHTYREKYVIYIKYILVYLYSVIAISISVAYMYITKFIYICIAKLLVEHSDAMCICFDTTKRRVIIVSNKVMTIVNAIRSYTQCILIAEYTYRTQKYKCETTAA